MSLLQRTLIRVDFEWDASKADSNQKKRGVSFEEAAAAFGDPLSLTIPDPDHTHQEDRFVLMGETNYDDSSWLSSPNAANESE